LPLEQRCQAENLYWAILVKLRKLVAQMEDVPEDLQGLDDTMADTYFCNFSLFQSCPDRDTGAPAIVLWDLPGRCNHPGRLRRTRGDGLPLRN
jgi:hypothetical protein